MNPMPRIFLCICVLVLGFQAQTPAQAGTTRAATTRAATTRAATTRAATTRAAAPQLDQGEAFFYLPAVLNSASFTTPEKPTLASPANGAVLNTLVPTFTFDAGSQASTTKVCLYFGTSPLPTLCNSYFLMSWWPNPPWSIFMWSNLTPNTVYYWRVGVIPAGEATTTWSDEWTFTSGPANGVYPAAPVLLAPQDGTSVPYADLTIAWSPVSDAVGYQILVRPVNASSYYRPTTSYTQTILKTTYLQPNTTYEWKVQTRNSYAYGPDSSTWTFTTGPAPTAP